MIGGVTGGGTTMLEMARALKPLPIKRENVKIVQLEGALLGRARH